jgi:hypothetical protein
MSPKILSHIGRITAFLMVMTLGVYPHSSAMAQSDAGAFDYQNYTGNQLLRDCTNDDPRRQVFCLVLVGDVIFAQRGLDFISPRMPDGSPCIPKGGDVSQMKDIVVKELQANPETRHENWLLLIVKAILKNNPSCQLPKQ